MPDATAMAVRDGTVVWLGSDDVGLAQFPDAEVVDLDGGFVAPAFVDSHVHLTATGLTLAGLDLRAATSVRHCLQLIAEYAQTHPDGPIWGHGWDESALAGSRAAQHRRPGRAWSVTGPPTWPASTSIRRRRRRHCGGSTPDLPAAQGFDAQRPLTADAHHLVRAAARDRLTPEQRARARLAALDLAAANGIVAVHECAGPTSAVLTTGTNCAAPSMASKSSGTGAKRSPTAEQAATLVETTGARGLAGDLFVDGALGSRTAWLQEPYADAPDRCGNAYLDRRRHHRASARLHRSGHHGRLPRDRRRGGQRRRRRSAAGGRRSSGRLRSPAAGTGSSTSRW